MKFYTKQHKYYCGVDLHAKTLIALIRTAQGHGFVSMSSRIEYRDCRQVLTDY